MIQRKIKKNLLNKNMFMFCVRWHRDFLFWAYRQMPKHFVDISYEEHIYLPVGICERLYTKIEQRPKTENITYHRDAHSF